MEQPTPTAPKPAEMTSATAPTTPSTTPTPAQTTTPNTTATGQTAKTPAILDPNRNAKGQFVKGNKPKSSFADRPQDRSNGHWKGRDTYDWCLRKFDQMTDAELDKWRKANPPSERTQAEKRALLRIKETTAESIKPKDRLNITAHIADRAYGKAVETVSQKVEITNPYDDLTTEQLEALAKQAENR